MQNNGSVAYMTMMELGYTCSISIEGSLSYFLLKSSLMKRDHTASRMASSSRDNKRIHGSTTDFNGPLLTAEVVSKRVRGQSESRGLNR